MMNSRRTTADIVAHLNEISEHEAANKLDSLHRAYKYWKHETKRERAKHAARMRAIVQLFPREDIPRVIEVAFRQ